MVGALLGLGLSCLLLLSSRTPVDATAAIQAVDPVPVAEDEDPIEVNIDWLTSLDYKRGMRLPQELLALDGKLVTISGYMAIGTLEGSEMFELVPESCECGRSKVQHFIEVTLTEETVRFQPGRFSITGIFDVGEVEEDGFIVSLYRLKAPAIR